MAIRNGLVAKEILLQVAAEPAVVAPTRVQIIFTHISARSDSAIMRMVPNTTQLYE
jgi:hypothetical protein